MIITFGYRGYGWVLSLYQTFRCGLYPLVPMEDTREGLTDGSRNKDKTSRYDN